MIIRGIDFPFSTLNAKDVDKMLAAQEKQQTRAAAEIEAYDNTPAGYSAQLRTQCRILMDFLDDVLGEGAAEKLGLDGEDLGDCMAVFKEFTDATVAEKEAASEALRVPAVTQNREQRRAAAKSAASAGKLTAGKIIPMDKNARRKQLLAELAALDD